MFLTIVALVAGLAMTQDTPAPQPPVATSSQASVSVRGGYFLSTPQPHFVFPFQQREHSVNGWFAGATRINDTRALTVTGLYVPRKSHRAFGYAGDVAGDFNDTNTRFGVNMSLWGNQNQFALASNSVIAMGSTNSTYGILVGAHIGRGSLSTTYIRLGPSAGVAYATNDFTLASPGATARDAINHTVLPMAGATALAGVHTGPLRIQARLNAHWLVRSERAWGTNALSAQVSGMFRLWRGFGISADAAWASPTTFDAVPFSKRVGIGLSWTK